MRKTIILIISAVLVCTAIAYAGAKSYAQKDEAMIELQIQLIAEQTEKYTEASEDYSFESARCTTTLSEIQARMDKAHNLAEAHRATIQALSREPLDFSLPQNK